MKKTLSIFILWLSLALPTSADGPIYLPVINQACGVEANMSDFKVVVPEDNNQAFTNYVLNPSAEIAGSYTALDGATLTLSSAFQHYGLYSYRLQTSATDMGMSLLLEGLPFVNHYITIRVHTTTLTAAWGWSLDDVNFTAPTLLEVIDSEWSLYGVSIPAAQANGSNELYIRQSGAGALDLYLDGIQVEPKDGYYTTFCDGTQPGCEWTGAAHSSASLRSPDSRAGGRVLDLEDDYGFNVSGMSGTGTAPQELFIDSYSQLPGGELNSRKINSRVITLNGFIDGTDGADFWAKKEAIQALFDPEAFPEDENGEQPVRLRFVGAAVHKEIAVFYEGGLETTITADDPACAREKVAVRFVADDPYWYEIGESAALLDTEDTATFRTVAGRLRSTGEWDDLGPPHASGTYGLIQAITEDATYVYFGGLFTNFDNIAAADYIVRLNKQTGVWSALGTGGPNSTVDALVIGPDGKLYVGHEGTVPGNGAGVWDTVAETWAALGTGLNGIGAAVTVSPTGLIVYGGTFTTAGGGAALRVATWDPVALAWAALGGGLDARVRALLYSQGILYAAGDFTGRLSSWDGASWAIVGVGLDNPAYSLAASPDGRVFIGGTFTDNVALWNGTILQVLPGSGINDNVHSLAWGPDGILYIDAGSEFVQWNGSTTVLMDFQPPGTMTGQNPIFVSQYVDPVVPTKYSIYVGFDTTGTGAKAGNATIANGGTAPAFPKIIFQRSGGTTATLQSIKNERTGLQIFLNWSLLAGETFTLDLAPTKKSAVSSTGIPTGTAILANSDLGDWSLLSGNNNISAFVPTTGAPTIVAYLLWKDTFKSQ